jgi:uncharacterized protein (DUF433 family)
MAVVAQEYIEVDDRGVARLIGTRVKVKHLVMAQRGEGYSAEQLIEQYPNLGPARVYAALAYYHDHKAEVDQQIEDGLRFADEMRAKNPNRFTREELRVRWKERFPDRPFPGEGDAEPA